MGFVGDALGAVFKGVGNVIHAVAHGIAKVVTGIVKVIADIFQHISKNLAGIIKVLFVAVTAYMGAAAISGASSSGGASSGAGSLFGKLKGFVVGMGAKFDKFLDFIHFDTLSRVNNVAQLVSKDYRQMMGKVYGSIAEYSEALGLGANYLPLLLENARAVVLDVSSSLGRSYDMCEIVWLQELSNWSKRVNKVGVKYKNRPELLIQDINDWIIKPHVDDKAAATSTVFRTVDGLLDTTEDVVNKVVKTRNDIGKLVHDLPGFIRKDIEPKIRAVTKQFDDFISYKYRPAIEAVNELLAVVDRRVDATRGHLVDLVDRLKRPGDILADIDNLSYDESRIQKLKVATVVSEGRDLVSSEVVKNYKPLVMEMKSISRLLSVELPEVSWAVGESVTPIRTPQRAMSGANTWFVGDY